MDINQLYNYKYNILEDSSPTHIAYSSEKDVIFVAIWNIGISVYFVKFPENPKKFSMVKIEDLLGKCQSSD